MINLHFEFDQCIFFYVEITLLKYQVCNVVCIFTIDIMLGFTIYYNLTPLFVLHSQKLSPKC